MNEQGGWPSWLSDAGCWMLVAACSVLVAGRRRKLRVLPRLTVNTRDRCRAVAPPGTLELEARPLQRVLGLGLAQLPPARTPAANACSRGSAKAVDLHHHAPSCPPPM